VLIATDAHALRRHLREQLGAERVLADSRALKCNGMNLDAVLHLAVMTGPFLDMIIDGEKLIESRFHRVRQAPLFAIGEGDLIAFKQSGGPVKAVARVTTAWFEDLTFTSIAAVRDKWAQGLGATNQEFWAARQSARWVTMMRLSDVRKIEAIRVQKRDRRAWVRYDQHCAICFRATPDGLLAVE
jgi:hypothetical protein